MRPKALGTVLIAVMIMMVMIMPTNALLTDKDVSAENGKGLWQKIVGVFGGAMQSVFPEANIAMNPAPGSVYTYRAVQQSTGGAAHPCGASNAVLGWAILDVNGYIVTDRIGTNDRAMFIEADKDTSRGVAGAKGGVARIKWVKAGSYKISVVYTCGATQVKEELEPILVSTACPTTLNIGAQACVNGVPQTVVKLSNGCTVWISGATCGTNAPCQQWIPEGSHLQKAACVPINRCDAGAIQCVSSTQYKQCETVGAGRDWVQHSVPTPSAGYEWSCTDGAVRRSISDPCRSLVCSDGNSETVDSCSAGKCVFTPDCDDGSSWDSSTKSCIENVCVTTPEQPCEGAMRDSFPSCGWDLATCTGDVADDGDLPVTDVCPMVWELNSDDKRCIKKDGGCIVADGETTFKTKVSCSAKLGKLGSGDDDNTEELNVPSWVLPSVLGIIVLAAAGIGFFMFRKKKG